MKKEQISFAIAGVIFGFLVGFVVSHEIYGGRFAGVPVMGGSSMAGSPRGPAQSGAGDASPAGGGGAPPMDMMQQVQQELDALKQAVKEDPRNVAALGRLARLYMDAGMYDQAAKFYSDALDVDPANVHIRTDLGSCLLMMGKADDALRQLKDATARDAGHGQTWYWMGLAHVERGEYEEGEAAFARALELSPGSFDMAALRAEIEKLKAKRAGKPGGVSPS